MKLQCVLNASFIHWIVDLLVALLRIFSDIDGSEISSRIFLMCLSVPVPLFFSPHTEKPFNVHH